VENQNYAWRIDEILKVPAVVHGLSMEPLLGPMTLPEEFLRLGNQGWVIAGGESGRKPRPSQPDWFRSLRDQCVGAGVPFHFKQWGECGSDLVKIGKRMRVGFWMAGNGMSYRWSRFQRRRRKMTNGGHETYYCDPTAGERLTATYLVSLVVPSNHFGQIEVEAPSEEEAARLALDRANEIDWECPRLSLGEIEIEVLDIECDDPPEGVLLSRPPSREADTSVFLEDASTPADNRNANAPVLLEEEDGHR
jgi:hypothetical protein